MENIIKQGYLKRAIISDDFTATSSKNFTNSFRQKLEPSRWYVFGVRRRQPYLEYFEKEQSSFTGSPISSYDLTACTGISYTLGNTNRNYSFCVFLNGQVLELNAPSREEMVSWCSVLERNLRRLGILDKHSRRDHIYSAFPVKPKPVPAPRTSISLEDVVPTRSTIFIEQRWEEQKEKNPCQEMQSSEGQVHQDFQVNMDTELLGATGGVSEKSEREKYYLDDEEIHVSIDSIKLEDLLAEEEERVQDLKRKTDGKEEQNNGGQNKIETNNKKTKEDSTEISDRDTSEDSDFISASFWLRNRKPTITAMPREKSKVSAAFGQTGQSLLDSILHDDITQKPLVPMRRSYNTTENSHKQGKRMAFSMCEMSSSGQNCVGFAEPGLNNSLYSFSHASSEYCDINGDGKCADKYQDESEEDDSRYEMLVDKISPPLPPRENRVQQALYEATWTPIQMGKAEYKEKLADIQRERLVSSSGGNSSSTNPQSSHLSPVSTEKHGQDNFYSELPLEINQTGKFNLHNINNDPRTIGKVVEKTDKVLSSLDLPPRLITKIPVGNPEPPPVNSIPKRANVATELVSNFLPKGPALKSMLLKNDPSFDNDGMNDTTSLIPFENEASPIPVAPPRRDKALTLDLRSEPMSAANYNYHNKTDLISDENLNHIVGSYNLRSPEKKLGNVDDLPPSPPVPPPRDIEKKTAPPSPPVPPPRDIEKKTAPPSPPVPPPRDIDKITALPIPPLPKRNVLNSTRKIKSQEIEDLPSGNRNETYVATRPRSTYLSFRQQLSPSPGALVVMNLKQSQVDILKAEIATTQGLILRIPKQHFQSGLALVECFGTIWIAGWDLKKYARLFDKFHIGDQLVAIQDVQVSDLSFVQKVVKNCQSQTMEVIIRRLPHAQVYAIRRNAEGENLGIKRDGGTAEILYVDPLGLAARHGLPSKAHMVDNVGTCSWMLTEINSRPLNLFFKDAEIEHLLSAVGLDISIVVQPADFIKELKKQLKKIKGYKDFLVK